MKHLIYCQNFHGLGNLFFAIARFKNKTFFCSASLGAGQFLSQTFSGF
jgi:hypothetical protein